MCTCVHACVLACVCDSVSVRNFLPPNASKPRNIGTYVFIVARKNFYIMIFAKNASFRSYGIICFPPMPLTTPEPQIIDTNGMQAKWASHNFSLFN